jgi:hypothetical protein
MLCCLFCRAQGMNYVVAALLLGRIPACYTNITMIDAAADESAPSTGGEDESDGNNSGDAAAEPALAIVRAAAAAEVMPGTVPLVSFAQPMWDARW